MIPYRTLLFVPGHKTGWIEKALAAGADCLVLDLEDSCPAELKETARDMVASSIRAIRERDPHIGILVRVNALGTRMTGADLEAVVVPGLTGVFVPMVSTASDVLKLDALVDHFEMRNGVCGLDDVIPTETVGAIQNVREIASASPRIGALIGPTAEHADIARAVGFRWTPEGQESLYLRSRVLLACREAGVHALTALWERLDDLDGLADFARGGRDLGFRGMVVIHPAHVPVVNDVFSPPRRDRLLRGAHRRLRRRCRQGRRRGALPRCPHRPGTRRDGTGLAGPGASASRASSRRRTGRHSRERGS